MWRRLFNCHPEFGGLFPRTATDNDGTQFGQRFSTDCQTTFKSRFCVSTHFDVEHDWMPPDAHCIITVRHPYAYIVSSAIYHNYTKEEWVNSGCCHPDFYFGKVDCNTTAPDGCVSHQGALRRLSLFDGIRLEMHMTAGPVHIRDMVNAKKRYGQQCLFLRLEDHSTPHGINTIIEAMAAYFGKDFSTAMLEEVHSAIASAGHVNPTKVGVLANADREHDKIEAFAPEHRSLFREIFPPETFALLGCPPDPFGDAPGYMIPI